MELLWRLRLEAGRWVLLKCNERGEWYIIRTLSEHEAQKLVRLIEG